MLWVFVFVVDPLTLLGLLLVLLALLLRLHDVVHQVVDVLIIHLLVRVVKLRTLSLVLLRLPLICAPFLLCIALPLVPQKVVVRNLTIVCLAAAHALSVMHGSLMIRELVTIRESVLACAIVGIAVGALVVSVLSIASHLLLIVLLLSLNLKLLGREVSLSVLVQVKVECLPLIEVVVSLRNGMAVILDLLNLVQMLLQGLTRVWCIVPTLGFVDYRSDCLILDNSADVNRVVHTSENAALIGVSHCHKVEQLQPQCL